MRRLLILCLLLSVTIPTLWAAPSDVELVTSVYKREREYPDGPAGGKPFTISAVKVTISGKWAFVQADATNVRTNETTPDYAVLNKLEDSRWQVKSAGGLPLSNFDYLRERMPAREQRAYDQWKRKIEGK